MTVSSTKFQFKWCFFLTGDHKVVVLYLPDIESNDLPHTAVGG